MAVRCRVTVALCTLAIRYLLGSADAAAAEAPNTMSRTEAIRAGVYLDTAGRVVYHPETGRLLYPPAPKPPAPSPPPADFGAPRLAPSTLTAGGIEITLEWYRATFGGRAGLAGMTVADLDGDGAVELVAAATGGIAGGGSYWYVVEADGDGYRQRWTSLPYDAYLGRLEVAQVDEDAALEVLVAVAGQLLIYDGQTFEIEAEHLIAVDWVYGLAVGELDGDTALEAALCDDSGTWIYDLATGDQQLALPVFGCSDLAIGETDGTAGLEIVIKAYGNAGWVLDGATGAVEWNAPLGEGYQVVLGDFDGDDLDEIAAGVAFSGIEVWHGDTRTLAWELPVFDLATMTAADVEADGDVELVYGDGQWGEVHVLNGTNGSEEWSVANPGHGVSGVAVGDVDEDGVREIFFGAGWTAGPDRLYAVDGVSHDIVWQSTDVSGPFYGLAHGDVDADGIPELVYTTFMSDSAYGDGLYFVHDAHTKALEYQSPNTGFALGGLWKIQLANVDLDPAREIFFPTRYLSEGRLQCIDPTTHDVQWEAPLVSGLVFQSLRLADPDSDGQLETASGVEVSHTGAPGVYVYVHSAATGALEWESPNLEGFFGFPTGLDLLRVADVDDDGSGELLVAARGGGLMSLDPVAGTVDMAAETLAVTALETVDLNGDGVEEIIIGTVDGFIQTVHPVSGAATALAGPYDGAIDGLAVVDVTADGEEELIFAAADRVHLVDGATHSIEWMSDDLGTEVGRSDTLLVADIDNDGVTEIWVNAGPIGHFVFAVVSIVFADGFESGDTTSWSATVP